MDAIVCIVCVSNTNRITTTKGHNIAKSDLKIITVKDHDNGDDSDGIAFIYSDPAASYQHRLELTTWTGRCTYARDD